MGALFSPLHKLIGYCVAKICSIDRHDIAKACIKHALYYSLEKKIIAEYGAFQIDTNHCIDYGCEAAWSGYYHGIDSVPGTLIKYACIEMAYNQLCSSASLIGIDYPQALKRNAHIHTIIQLLIPLVIRHAIAYSIDYVLAHTQDESENSDICVPEL